MLALTAFDEEYDAGSLCAAANACYCHRHGVHLETLVLTRCEMYVLCEGSAFDTWCACEISERREDLRVLGSSLDLPLAGHLLTLKGVTSHGPRWHSLRWLFDEGMSSATLDSRIGHVKDALASYHTLLWLDADLVITNHNQAFDVFLENKDLVLGEDMADLDWLNTGLFACQTQSAWVRSLWERVWAEGDPAFHQNEFWDQSALCSCLALWSEFNPATVGGKKRRPSCSDPWFSWQGGPRRKRTEHLLVHSAGVFQTNNPRSAQFAFHAAGMKDKKRSIQFIIESGGLPCCIRAK